MKAVGLQPDQGRSLPTVRGQYGVAMESDVVFLSAIQDLFAFVADVQFQPLDTEEISAADTIGQFPRLVALSRACHAIVQLAQQMNVSPAAVQ